MICIWGIKKIASPGQENMIEQCQNFLDWVTAENKTIIMPTPVITELLAPISDVAARNELMRIINTSFKVAPLDNFAAYKAGEIWNTHKTDWRDYYSDDHTLVGEHLRNRLKYDLLILGIAHAQRVECLYTNDAALRNLSIDSGLNSVAIPDIPKQTELEFKAGDTDPGNQ